MKDKFIRKEGLLFLECEPEQLDMDNHKTSLVRFIQDDTEMGKYNRETLDKTFYEGIQVYLPKGKYVNGYHYLRFEVIARHCPEGSIEWALWQMFNGKTISRTGIIYTHLNNEILEYLFGKSLPKKKWRIDEFMQMHVSDGWEIYEEPKQEPPKGTPQWAWEQMCAGKEVYRYDYDRNYRMNACGYVISTDGDYAYNYNQFLNIEHADDWLVHEIPKVGEWYKQGYDYYQCSSVHEHEEGTHVYLRKAGDKVSGHMTKSYGGLVPASLTPNFKDAKIGDKCFSIIDGPSEITSLCTDPRVYPVGYLSVSGADRACWNNGFELGSKTYPTLFHSAKQAVAYFAEVALKEENDG